MLPTSVASTKLMARLRASVSRIGRFGADRSGNIGMLFAFMIIPVVGIIGFSVDYGRALDSRTVLQTALDSAVLAAGRDYQVNGEATSAEDAAAEYFKVAMEGQPGVEIVENKADTANSKMKFTGKMKVKTTFARLLGVDELEVTSTAESQLAKGGIDTNLEIALMLDVTGSMCQPCTKLTDLKSAAKDLIGILVQDDQSGYTSRVAIAPFSHAVNVGSEYFEQMTGEEQEVEDQYNYPASCYRNGRLRSSCSGNPDYLSVEGHSYSSCVVERSGSEKFTDEPPGEGEHSGHGSGDDSFLGIFDEEKLTVRNGMVNSRTACKPETRIVPLSSDKAGLEDIIDQLSAGGSTAGHIGTAWSWYLLSPKWNRFWPSESAAAEYDDRETTKIAVLMTDGEYNTAYKSGNGSSQAQARELCSKMKSEGITVYTVGFMVGSSEKDLLEDCATSDSHFYDATSGDELKLAFRNIAFRVAQLRLSK